MKLHTFLKREYGRMLAVTVLSQLVTAVKTLTDTLVAGRALGESGLTAIALVSPIFLAFGLIEALIITGGMTAAQRAVGRGNKAECDRLFSQTAIALVAVGVVFSLFIFLFSGPLAALMGRGSMVVAQCADYLRLLSPSAVFLLVKDLLIAAACNDGKLTFVRLCTTAEMVLNAIFDCLLVGPFGVGGIALGSAVSGTLVCGVLVVTALQGRFSYRFAPWFSIKSFCASSTLGFSAAALSALSGVAAVAVNRYILAAFGERVVFLYSFVGTFSLFTAMLVGATQAAMQPFSSIFYGERNPLGMRALCKIAGRHLLWLCVLLGLGFAALSPFLGRVFGADAASWPQIGHVIRIQCAFVALYGVCGLLGAFYSGAGHMALSSINVILRTSAVLYPATVVLGSAFGVEGLWYARALAEGAALLITLCLACICARKGISPILLLDRRTENGSLCLEMDGSMEGFLSARDRTADFLKKSGASPAAVGKAMLYIEETGILAQQLRVGLCELTLLPGKTPTLIFRDNSKLDYTDPDSFVGSVQTYAALQILNSAASKAHIRSIGYNRVIYTL